MTDVARYGIRLDAGQAIVELQKYDAAIKQTVKDTDELTGKQRKQEEQLRSLAKWIAQGGDATSDYAKRIIQTNGGLEQFGRMQALVNGELILGKERYFQGAKAVAELGKAKHDATLSAGHFKNGLTALAAEVTGLNPHISHLASALGSFAIGSGVTVGVLAGIAAVGYAYEKLTEDTRKAREEQDKFVESLAKARDEAVAGSREGRAKSVDDAKDALKTRQQELANLRLAGPAGTADIAGGADFGADPKAKAAAIVEATKAVRQAKIDLQAAEAQIARDNLAAALTSAQIEQDGADRKKKWSDEAKKAEEEALQRLKQRIDLLTKLYALPDIGALTSNIDVRLGQGGGVTNDTINDRLRGPYDKTDPAEMKRQEEQSRFDVAWRKSQSEQILAGDKAARSMSGLDRAAQVAGQALEYYLVSKVGGGGVGSSVGAAVGKGLFQDAAAKGTFGSFGQSFTGQAILGPIAAGLGAAVGGIVDKLDIFGTHAKEAARQLDQLRAAAEASAQSYVTGILGSSKDQQLLDEQRAYTAQLDSLRNEHLSQEEEAIRKAELFHAHEEAYRRIVTADEEKKRYANEDLEVRALRATGHDKEADKLALDNRQQAEIAEALRSGMSEEYLARLRQVQALESSAQALNKLTTSVRNAPKGFNLDSYASRVSPPRTFTNPPLNPAFSPGNGGLRPGTVVFSFQGPVTVDAKDKTPEQAFAIWSASYLKLQSKTVGLNGNPADALNFLVV